MATADDRPLDEVVWSSPAIVQRMGFIHTNTVHPYFAESPFFDGTSNNAVVTNQAMFNPAMFHLIQSRAAFEGHLRSMAGLEFMVTHDPSDGDRVQDHSGVWVLRKQTRRKRPGADDEITPHASYFVVGDRIYMAPSVGGILESRVLSTVTALTKLLSTASALPIFSPALGHTYYSAAPSSSALARADVAGKDPLASTQDSREGTPAPEASARATPAPGGPAARSRAPAAAPRDDASTLLSTLRLAERFGSEYMDDAPLAGEPGAFVLGKAAGAGASRLSAVSNAAASSAAATATEGAAANGRPVVAPIKTDLAAEEKKRQKASGEKSPASPVTPGGGKKRKKSRVQGLSGGKISPS